MEILELLGKLIEVWPSWIVIIGILAVNLVYYKHFQDSRNSS